jgi:subtilase family serine protease
MSEVLWNDSGGASGGGVSTIVPKPPYQIGLGIPRDGFRDQLDVSLMASPSQAGYVMVIENTVQLIGGTSVATPSWAGIAALLNHATGRDGSGAINYSLYALGNSAYSDSGPLVFHDITSGDNGFNHVPGFAATRGFDLATGWGTPDVAHLVQAIASQACAGDCNTDGMITVDELLTAVDIALGAAPISQCQSVDADGDGKVSIDEVIKATTRALNGC